MKFKSPKPPESVIQMAPMIDIVFLLLIFFLVTWQFSRSEQDSKVKIPTSSQGKEETRAISEINVNIRQGGELVINGETLTDGSGGVTSSIDGGVGNRCHPDREEVARQMGAIFRCNLTVVGSCRRYPIEGRATQPGFRRDGGTLRDSSQNRRLVLRDKDLE